MHFVSLFHYVYYDTLFTLDRIWLGTKLFCHKGKLERHVCYIYARFTKLSRTTDLKSFYKNLP